MRSLPPGWVEVHLEEIVDLWDHLREPVNATERAQRQGPFPYFGANGQTGTIDDYRYDGDFVLLAEDGGYFDDATRGVAYVASGKFWVNNHAHVLKPRAGMSTTFLMRLLNSIDWMPHVGGSTRLKLTQGAMNKVLVPLPPLSEQRRIVAKLEALLARSRRAREALDSVPAMVERFRQSVLAAAFRGDLTRDWREKNPDVEPAVKLLERIRAERDGLRGGDQQRARRRAKAGVAEQTSPPLGGGHLPNLPRGWVWITVEEAGQIDLGRMRSPDKHRGANVRPYLRVKNVFENRIDVSDLMEMQFEPEEFEFYRLRAGDVLLNEGQSRELVGRPAIFRGEHPDVAFTNSLIRFRPYGGAPPEYSLALFRHYMRSGRFMKIAQITTNIAHLGAGRLRTLEFPLPPLEEQFAIASAVTSALASVDALEARLNAVRDQCGMLESAVISKAFRGELVPQDPNDEPASFLLERIRGGRDGGEASAPRDAQKKQGGPRRVA